MNALPLFTATSYLAAYDPASASQMPPDIDLSDDTAKAHKIAVEGGLSKDIEGRYPAIVWFSVYP